jgi:hypothetical protein
MKSGSADPEWPKLVVEALDAFVTFDRYAFADGLLQVEASFFCFSCGRKNSGINGDRIGGTDDRKNVGMNECIDGRKGGFTEV